jgi:hypothetical protein
MKKYIFVLLLFALSACGGESYPIGMPTATPNPGEIALQMMQQQMAANATAQVVGLNFTATAQVIGATATAQQILVYGAQTEQARVDAQATSAQARRDAQATQQRQDAIATAERQQKLDDAATQQAMIAIQNTQSADATMTFTVMTLTAIPPHATMTQIAVDNQIVINNQNVEKAALDLQQTREMNNNWKIYLLLGVVMFGAGLLWVVRKSRWYPFIDDDGKLLGFGFDEQYVNPRLLTGPVLDMKTKTMPQVSDPVIQAKVTERAQIVEALAAMPEQTTRAAGGVFNKYFGEKQDKPYEIIDGDLLPPTGLLDSQALKSIENDWKEAKDGQ